MEGRPGDLFALFRADGKRKEKGKKKKKVVDVVPGM